MWKSLFVTSGELIVFMDADLVDWDTHFVPGLLGPLLTDPGVELVKGFYERPMVVGGAAVPFEGGRVTELVARPLIRLLFPELAGLHQPLAGEWAVRRSLFEQLQRPARVRRRAGRAGRHPARPRARRDRAGRPRRTRPPAPVAARPERHGDPDPGRGAGPGRRRPAGRGAAAGGEASDDAASWGATPSPTTRR